MEEALASGFVVALGLCATLWNRSSRSVSGQHTTTTTRGGGYRYPMPEGIKSIDPEDPYTMYVDFFIKWRSDPKEEFLRARKLRLLPSKVFDDRDTPHLLLISLDNVIPHEIDYDALKDELAKTLELKAGLLLKSANWLGRHDFTFVHDEVPIHGDTPVHFELGQRYRTLVLQITMDGGTVHQEYPYEGDTFIGAWQSTVAHSWAERRANRTLKRTIGDTISDHAVYLGHPEHPVKRKEYLDMGGVRRLSKRIAIEKADAAKKKRGEEPLPFALDGIGVSEDHAITDPEMALVIINARRKRHGREPIPWMPKFSNLDITLVNWQERERLTRNKVQIIKETRNSDAARDIAHNILNLCSVPLTRKIALAWQKYMSALQSAFGEAGVDETRDVIAQFVDIHWIGSSGDNDCYEDAEGLVPTALTAIQDSADDLWTLIGVCVNRTESRRRGSVDNLAQDMHYLVKECFHSVFDQRPNRSIRSVGYPAQSAGLYMTVFASDTAIGQALRSKEDVRKALESGPKPALEDVLVVADEVSEDEEDEVDSEEEEDEVDSDQEGDGDDSEEEGDEAILANDAAVPV